MTIGLDAPVGLTTTASPEPRVVHVPAEHAYVVHATTLPTGAGAADAPHDPIERAPRGPQQVADAPDGFRWADGPAWVSRNARSVDVLHVHLGMEQVDAATLERTLVTAAHEGLPVVWTVHDLTNPHLVDQSVHEAQLALLARHSAGLLTLTPGAAVEVEQRWGRRPVVVPHPHLAPLDVLARRRPAVDRAVVLVPLGLLRPATDPATVRALLSPPGLDALADGGASLRVTLREEVLAPGFPRPAPALVDLLRRAHDDGRLELVVGPRTPEARLWDELSQAAALVLPYRWGTHSGWVEACHDVGTPVVAPDLGRWGEQHPLHVYRTGPDGPDPGSLAGALGSALRAGPRAERVLDARLAERRHVVALHTRLHRTAAAGGRW